MKQDGSPPDRRAEPATPSEPFERIQLVDSLRGLALFGVLVMNLETAFRVSLFHDFLPSRTEGALDRAVETALRVFVDLKAFAIFSLLFGLGLAIQHQRLQGHPARLILLIRRLVVLLAFGLIHLYLIWNGDVLTEYAVVGLVVLPFLYAPTRVVAAACGVILFLYIAMPVLPSPAPLPDSAWMVEHVARAQQVYSSGGFLDILEFRVQEVAALVPLHVQIFPRTLGLFLLGIVAWRTQFIQSASRHAGLVWLLAAVGVGVGLLLTLVGRDDSLLHIGRLALVAASAATIALAVGYVSLVIALGNLRDIRTLLAFLAPMGRMAFTNYVCQSVVLGFIFYGYGFGLFGKIGWACGLVIALLLYLAQVLLSRWWLNRFKFGPIEWIWRVLMYGRYAHR
jgi:uncharacterized protein